MNRKKLFTFDTGDIVASFAGAAIFCLLHRWVCIDGGFLGTIVHTAYGFGAVYSAIFGPIVGGVLAFIGSAVSDAVRYGGDVVWSWVAASVITCFVAGLCKRKINVRIGWCEREDVIIFNIYQALGNVVGWFIVAPLWEIFFNFESPGSAFGQCLTIGVISIFSTGLVGTGLLWLAAKYARRALEEKDDEDDYDDVQPLI